MNQTYWDKARAFHGYECPGLAIGVRACEAATENDACGVDAVQALMSCTVGKGNLIFKNTGKQVFTFISWKTGKAMRFYLRIRRNGMERATYQQYLLDAPTDVLFTCQELNIEAPEHTRLFSSTAFEKCGELAPEHKIRVQEGKNVCLDCYKEYSRGWG